MENEETKPIENYEEDDTFDESFEDSKDDDSEDQEYEDEEDVEEELFKENPLKALWIRLGEIKELLEDD